MKKNISINGVFSNSIRYVKMGNGIKTVFLLLGGPGDMFKPERAESMLNLFSELLNKDYSVYILGRRRHLPYGYSMADMSRDVVEVIDEDFGGFIEAVIGVSFGGYIVHHIASKNSNKVSKLITVGSVYNINKEAAKMDKIMTNSISKGDYQSAFKYIPEVLFSQEESISRFENLIRQSPEEVFDMLFNHDYDDFLSDMKIECEACHNLDHTTIIKDINCDILLIGGTKDVYFSTEDMKRTSEMIKSSKLVMLEGCAHGELLNGESLSAIMSFIDNSAT